MLKRLTILCIPEKQKVEVEIQKVQENKCFKVWVPDSGDVYQAVFPQHCTQTCTQYKLQYFTTLLPCRSWSRYCYVYITNLSQHSSRSCTIFSETLCVYPSIQCKCTSFYTDVHSLQYTPVYIPLYISLHSSLHEYVTVTTHPLLIGRDSQNNENYKFRKIRNFNLKSTNKTLECILHPFKILSQVRVHFTFWIFSQDLPD